MPINELEQLYSQNIRQVFRYVYTRVRNREVAEDIVSASYLKAAEHLQTFVRREHASTRSWLFAIVRNTMNDHFRARPTVELVDEHASPALTAEHLVDIDLAHSRVMELLEKIPDRQREILLLRYQGELRNKEIAELLGIDQKSVSASLAKAISTIRTHLYV